MVTHVDMPEAQAQLPSLLAKVEAGETVVIEAGRKARGTGDPCTLRHCRKINQSASGSSASSKGRSSLTTTYSKSRCPTTY